MAFSLSLTIKKILKDILDIKDDKVNKTGDTMTGDLTVPNVHGIADFAAKIKGDKIILENGTEIWIE